MTESDLPKPPTEAELRAAAARVEARENDLSYREWERRMRAMHPDAHPQTAYND